LFTLTARWDAKGVGRGWPASNTQLRVSPRTRTHPSPNTEKQRRRTLAFSADKDKAALARSLAPTVCIVPSGPFKTAAMVYQRSQQQQHQQRQQRPALQAYVLRLFHEHRKEHLMRALGMLCVTRSTAASVQPRGAVFPQAAYTQHDSRALRPNTLSL